MDIRVGHRVHAGELQRVEESLRERQQHDHRQRRAGRHQREEADRQSQHDRIHDQYPPESMPAQDP